MMVTLPGEYDTMNLLSMVWRLPCLFLSILDNLWLRYLSSDEIKLLKQCSAMRGPAVSLTTAFLP